jgi:putative FmdB family regulatory protein
MPIYEFECEECGTCFEELVAADAAAPCASCGSAKVRRLLSNVSPPGRQPRGHRVRSDEGRRQEREAGHFERLAQDTAQRAKGEIPRSGGEPAKKSGGGAK